MIGRGAKRHYDPEICFDAWLATGSLEKASEILYSKGIKSRKGTKPPWISVQRSANLYMIENLDIVRKRLVEEGGLEYLKNDFQWHKFIIKRAQTSILSDKSFKSWLIHHDFMLIAKQLKIVPEHYDD